MAGAASAAKATEILTRRASYAWKLGAQSDPIMQSRLLSLTERPPPPFWPRRGKSWRPIGGAPELGREGCEEEEVEEETGGDDSRRRRR